MPSQNLRVNPGLIGRNAGPNQALACGDDERVNHASVSVASFNRSAM